MPVSVGYFAEANLLCVFMLFIFVLSIFHSTDKQESRMLFAYNIITLAICNVATVFWLLLSYSPYFSYIHVLTYLVFFIWSGSIIASSFLWFLYSESLQQNDKFSIKKNRLLLAIPSVVMMLFVFSTPETGFFVKIMKARTLQYNTYSFSAGLYVLLVFCFVYPMITTIKALVKGIREKDRQQKKSLFLIAFYPIIPLVCGIIQTNYLEVPIFCFACVGAVLITFVLAQSGKISNDPLTRLNNRNELNNYASRAIKDREINGDLWLIMFDLDKFKPINDIYGHVEGDKALIKMADILRASCKSSQMHRNFISRFGGDEFIIITSAEAERDRIIEEVKRLMEEENTNSGKPYQLLSSVGYAKYESSMGGLNNWMKVADERLYQNKEERKKAGIA